MWPRRSCPSFSPRRQETWPVAGFSFLTFFKCFGQGFTRFRPLKHLGSNRTVGRQGAVWIMQMLGLWPLWRNEREWENDTTESSSNTAPSPSSFYPGSKWHHRHKMTCFDGIFWLGCIKWEEVETLSLDLSMLMFWQWRQNVQNNKDNISGSATSLLIFFFFFYQ